MSQKLYGRYGLLDYHPVNIEFYGRFEMAPFQCTGTWAVLREKRTPLHGSSNVIMYNWRASETRRECANIIYRASRSGQLECSGPLPKHYYSW